MQNIQLLRCIKGQNSENKIDSKLLISTVDDSQLIKVIVLL